MRLKHSLCVTGTDTEVKYATETLCVTGTDTEVKYATETLSVLLALTLR